MVYSFDAEGRLTQSDQQAGGVSGRVVTQEYDDRDRVIRVASPEGAVNYEFDPATGRMTRTFTGTTGSFAGDQADPVNDFRYGYDELGRLATVEVWERNDVPVDSDPGTAGNQPETTAYGYDLVGNLSRADLPNGIVSDYRYDDLNRLLTLTHFSPDATPQDLSDNPPLAKFDYTLRPDGKRTHAVETRWDSGSPQTTQIDWTYDDLGRLTDEVFNHYDDLLDYIDRYDYDLSGNRLLKEHDGGGNGSVDESIAYSYDANDRLLTEVKDIAGGTAGDTTTAYEYGGPTNPGTEQTKKSVTDTATSIVRSATNFSYDLQGRMQQVTIDTFDAAGVKTRTERTTFDYDDAGWRVSTLQEIDADADGTFETRTRTEFLADKSNFSGYAQTLQEVVTDADTGAEIKRVVYTIGLDVVAQTTFEPGGPAQGETHVFLYDGHGSVRMLADLLAAVVESYNFDAYGNAVGFDPAAALTSLLYSGEHFNPAIGQQYLRARWYDALTGRFGRLDPFSGNQNDPQSLHKYLYTHGDPINGVDPSGNFLTGGFGGFLTSINWTTVGLSVAASLGAAQRVRQLVRSQELQRVARQLKVKVKTKTRIKRERDQNPAYRYFVHGSSTGAWPEDAIGIDPFAGAGHNNDFGIGFYSFMATPPGLYRAGQRAIRTRREKGGLAFMLVTRMLRSDYNELWKKDYGLPSAPTADYVPDVNAYRRGWRQLSGRHIVVGPTAMQQPPGSGQWVVNPNFPVQYKFESWVAANPPLLQRVAIVPVFDILEV